MDSVGRPHDAANRQQLRLGDVARERPHVIGGRIRDQLLGRTELDNPPLVHDGYPIGQTDGFVEVVRDEDDGLMQKVLEAEEFILHFPPDQRVERRKRLVQKPYVGLDGERSTNPHALLLTSRQLSRIVAFTTLQSDQFDNLAGSLVPLCTINTLHLERKSDVVDHRSMGKQREVLKNHPHLVAAYLDQFPLRRLEEIGSLKQYLTSGGFDQTRETTDYGRLSRPRQAHDHQDLSRMNVEIGVLNRADMT